MSLPLDVVGVSCLSLALVERLRGEVGRRGWEGGLD